MQTAIAASSTEASATTQAGFTLHLQNTSREQLLEEFSRAAHLSFSQPAPGFWARGGWPTPTVSLDIDDEPFWTALSHLQEAADLGFVADEKGEHITPTRERGDWGWTGRPEAVCGPMLLSVRQVGRRTTVPLEDAAAAVDQITIVMQALIQPGADWSIDPDGFEMTSLRTDEDLELQPQKKPLRAANQQMIGRSRCQFSAFAPVGTKVASLTFTGNCHCIGSPSEETIEFPNAETLSIDRDIAGFAIHLASHRSAQGIEVRMTCKVPPGTDRKSLFAFRQRLSLIWVGRVKLFDANEIELISRPGFDRPAFPRRGFGRFPSTMPAIDHVDLIQNFTPADGPAPYKLVWTTPTALNDIIVPIKIEDIPVP